jgi:four helix bundle protein
MKYENFTQMPVWKKAFDLMLKVYQVTKGFPPDERFGLTSDMRRCANSIVHNIAEGFGRFYPKEKSHFYRISRGSGYELWSQILASEALSYLTTQQQEELIPQCQEVIEELDRLMKSLSA